MSLLGRIMAFFPAVALGLDIAAVVSFLRAPSWLSGALVPTAIYLFPLLSFRLVSLFRPLVPGITHLDEPRYSPWWGAFQMQLIFWIVPRLEAPLLVVPGLYQAWLRAWGSTIGKDVYFTPTVRIHDRSMLRVGSGVVFGHDIDVAAHFITPIKGRQTLIVDPVRVEDGAFIGAGVRLGPGVVVEKGAMVGAFAKLSLRVRVPAGTSVPVNATIHADRAPPASDVRASEAS